MNDHIYRKFPERVEKIQALMQKDAVFAEICADYEEMYTWLIIHCCAHGQPCQKCEDAIEIIRDLEDEITQALGGNPEM